MTDKEILDEVYRRLCCTTDNWSDMNMDRMFDRVYDMKDMIEQEWQKADEAARLDEELHDEMCRHDPWMNTKD